MVFNYPKSMWLCVILLAFEGDIVKSGKIQNPVSLFFRKPTIFKNRFLQTEETVQLGSTALFDCNVADGAANVTVEWWKVNSTDEGPLTRNNVTNSDDKRYLPFLVEEDSNHYAMKIRFTQQADAGVYECRVSGELQGSLFVNLKLIRAYARIKVNPKEPKAGRPLRLSCVLKESIKAPLYIFWYRDDRVLNYNLTEGATIRKMSKGSELIFPSAKDEDSGNYTCVPSNADQRSITIKVTSL